jgi:glycosyltransferase involved in cell wall biosynthesis
MIITTFHDMGFFLYPEYYTFFKRSFFRKRMKIFLNRSDRIIAISRSTKNAILKFFPEQEKKISVIYPGVDHLLKENIKPISSQNLDGPFILAVNSFEKRKNIPFIIKLFNLFKESYGTNHKMIIIGHSANGYQQILKEKEESIFSSDIHILESIPIEQVVYFYKNSDFFINASSYEGFGFSPFEAVNYNLPGFLLKNQVIAELLNHHSYIFTDLDEKIWAEHIHNEFQNNFANKILPESINHLTWKNAAEQSFELFHQLISEEEMAVA